MTAAGRPAVFLDRDGVLIEEVGHLHRPEQLRLIAGAGAAVRLLQQAGYLVIVVTNQSAVARGLLSEAELAVVHERLAAELLRAGATLDDIYFCPHHPTEGVGPYRRECACRKPSPGMLLAAQARHGIELGRSYLVGDKRSDLEAARRAGCTPLLVRTGHGIEEEAAGFGSADRPERICADLVEAAAYVADAGCPRAATAGSVAPGSP